MANEKKCTIFNSDIHPKGLCLAIGPMNIRIRTFAAVFRKILSKIRYIVNDFDYM